MFKWLKKIFEYKSKNLREQTKPADLSIHPEPASPSVPLTKVQEALQEFKTNQFIDPHTGQLTDRFKPLISQDDIFLPRRPNLAEDAELTKLSESRELSTNGFQFQPTVIETSSHKRIKHKIDREIHIKLESELHQESIKKCQKLVKEAMKAKQKPLEASDEIGNRILTF